MTRAVAMIDQIDLSKPVSRLWQCTKRMTMNGNGSEAIVDEFNERLMSLHKADCFSHSLSPVCKNRLLDLLMMAVTRTLPSSTTLRPLRDK